MRRIVIIGNSGSGKSTLARRLGERLGLPVVHLDVLFWEPGWTEPDNAVFRSKVAEAIAGDAWVSDGNYLSRTFDLRLPRADLVVWLDTPRLVCAARVLVRTGLGRPRPDLPAGCSEHLNGTDFPEFIRSMWDFDRLKRPRLEAALLAYGVPVVHLRTRRDVERFVSAIPSALPPGSQPR